MTKNKKAAALSDLFLGVLPADEVRYNVIFETAFKPED